MAFFLGQFLLNLNERRNQNKKVPLVDCPHGGQFLLSFGGRGTCAAAVGRTRAENYLLETDFSIFFKILLEADLRISIEKIMNIVEAIPVAQLCG